MGKIKNLDPRYTLESALDEIEHITKAYNWVAALHTEAVVERSEEHTSELQSH